MMNHTGCVHMDPAAVTDSHPPSGKTAPAQDCHELIDSLADKVEARIIEIRHDLHQNPELPNREFRTAKIIADHLRSLNVDEVKGMGVHGSTPWMGKDPLTVAAEIILALGQIYRHIPATEAITISIGKVDDKGRFNVIGDNITLWGTVRYIHQHVMKDVNERIVRISEHVAQAHGLTAEVSFDQAVPAAHNEPEWLDRFLPTMERLFRHDNMRIGPPQMAYDDHSCFQIACGGVYLFMGAQDTTWTENGLEPIDPNKPIPFNHNPRYYVKDELLKTGIRMHANVVMDFLTGQI